MSAKFSQPYIAVSNNLPKPFYQRILDLQWRDVLLSIGAACPLYGQPGTVVTLETRLPDEAKDEIAKPRIWALERKESNPACIVYTASRPRRWLRPGENRQLIIYK